MGEPPVVTVGDFVGLDLRRGVDASAPNSLREATNLDLTTGGGLRSRAQLRPFAVLDSTSLGLYVANGFLRTALPVPASGVFTNPPPGMRYDWFSNRATGGDLGTALRLTASQVWDRVPYVVIEKYLDPANPGLGFQYEHHYIPEVSTYSIAVIGKTAVTTPFTPGPFLFAMARKLISHDQSTNDVWYSSSINGPTDWSTSGDAGYLPVTQHVNGDPEVRGFSYFGNKLAVFFRDNVQLWGFFTDPADNEVSDIIGGAGTDQSGSVANMMGDSIYFAQGGFRSLSVAVSSGQAEDGDIGANIQAETVLIDPSTVQLVSLWSSSRAQYMCAVGSVMYVMTNSRQANVKGWTKYTLPFTITHMVEFRGKVYVRSGNTVYVFDNTYSGESGYAWTARFPYLYAGEPGRKKQWIAYETQQSGTQNLTIYPNVRNEAITHPGPTVTGSTIGINHIPLTIVADAISPKMTGTLPWQMDGFSFRLQVGNS
jgi:hypothetical protein